MRAAHASTRQGTRRRLAPPSNAECPARPKPAHQRRTLRSRARRQKVSWQSLRCTARLALAQQARREHAALAVARLNPPLAASLGLAFEGQITVAIGGD